MAKYDRSTQKYVTVECTIEISFPENKIICDYCPFCHPESYGTRYRCSQTGEILPFHNEDYGLRCPLPIPNKLVKGEEDE